jgi:hypothetical protein
MDRQTRKCFIHIGMHKTGTTSIQLAIKEHAAELYKQGYLYPPIGPENEFKAHHDIARYLMKDTGHMPISEIEEDLFNIIGKTNLDVILSSEDFLRALYYNPARFQTFINKINGYFQVIYIIIYLRNQASFLQSNYFERLKYGFKMPFDDYVEQRLVHDIDEFPLDYTKFLSIAERLDGSNLIVRSYDLVRKSGAVSDFFSILGAELSTHSDQLRVNTKQPLSELIKTYYEASIGRPVTASEHDIIGRIASSFPENSPRMSNVSNRIIYEACNTTNIAIEKEYNTAGLSIKNDNRSTGPLINHLFSSELISIINALSLLPDQLDKTQLALDSAQALASERYSETIGLREQLGKTQFALDKAQALASGRYSETIDLREQLDKTQFALDNAQALASGRYSETIDLREQLDKTQLALDNAQALASGRYSETIDLREQLDKTQLALDKAQTLAIERYSDITNGQDD